MISHKKILIFCIDKILLGQNRISQCETLSYFSGNLFRCNIMARTFYLFIEKIRSQNLSFTFWKSNRFLKCLNGLIILLSREPRIKINFVELMNRRVWMMVLPWKGKSHVLVFGLRNLQTVFPVWTLFHCSFVLKRIPRLFLHFKFEIKQLFEYLNILLLLVN